MREFAYWWGDIQFYRCCLSGKLEKMREARNAIIELKNLGFEPEYFDQMITCFFDIFAYLQRYDEDFQKFRLTEQFKHNKRKRKHADAEGE